LRELAFLARATGRRAEAARLSALTVEAGEAEGLAPARRCEDLADAAADAFAAGDRPGALALYERALSVADAPYANAAARTRLDLKPLRAP
jgi:hypothetical protein